MALIVDSITKVFDTAQIKKAISCTQSIVPGRMDGAGS